MEFVVLGVGIGKINKVTCLFEGVDGDIGGSFYNLL